MTVAHAWIVFRVGDDPVILTGWGLVWILFIAFVVFLWAKA